MHKGEIFQVYIGNKEARPARFERATCGFEVRRSIQLSYGRAGVSYSNINGYRRNAQLRGWKEKGQSETLGI